MRPQTILPKLLLSVLLGAAAPLLAMSPQEGQAPEDQPGTASEEKDLTFQQTIEVTTTPNLPQEVRTSGEEITERNPADLAGVMRHEPGLDALRQGPINLDPQVRALRETQLLVLVDGTRTHPAGPARMDSEMSHVDPDMVESLRIVKGPYALSWGSGAMAAISVDTFEAPFRKAGLGGGGRLTLGYGDNADARNAGALGWLAGERWRLTLIHDSREGHDYESGGGETVPGDYTSHTSRWTLGFQPRPGLSLAWRGSYQRQDDIDYPGRLLDATYFAHRSHSLEGAWQRQGGQVFGQLYSSFKDHLMNNDERPSPMRVRFPTQSDTVGARTVRFPTALERYSDRFPGTRYQISAEFLGDPGLEPEDAVQLDLGAAWAASRTSVDVQVFYRVLDQPITLLPDPTLSRRLPSSPPLVYRFVNGDQSTWWGGEAQLRGTLGEAWFWRAGLSWIRAEDDTFDEPAFGVPPLVTRLGLRWQPAERPFWADLSARVAGDQDRVASTLGEQSTPGSTLLDLYGGYRISPQWAVRAGLENLLDEDFTNHLNPLDPFTGERVPEPGRSFSLGLTLSR